MNRTIRSVGVFCLAALLTWCTGAAAQTGPDWVEQASGTNRTLLDVWGTSENDVFAVGQAGTVLHFDGSDWSSVDSGTNSDLEGVWTSSPGLALAVGKNGVILRCAPAGCTALDSPTMQNLFGVRGNAPDNVFAVGDGGVILRYDGDSWQEVNDSGNIQRLNGVWVGEAEVFAAGTNRTILRSSDGLAGWEAVANLPQLPAGTSFNGLTGRGSTVFVAGDGGNILRSSRTGEWSALESGAEEVIYGIWAAPESSDVFAVGFGGMILHSGDNGATWNREDPTPVILRGIWGSTASDLFSVGDGGTVLRTGGGGTGQPVAEDQSVETDEDAPLAITLGPADENWTYEVAVEPENGKAGAVEGIANTVVYQPDKDFNGSDSFIFRVSDGAGSSTATVSITVNPVNDPPFADAGPNQTVPAGASVVLDGGNSFDPDGGDLEDFAWEQISGPAVSLGADGPLATFSAPDVESSASLVFELTVTDPLGASSSDRTIVNVTKDNRPPRADAGPQQIVRPGDEVTLSALNSTDPDPGDAIADFQWIQVPGAGPSVELTVGSNPALATFTAPGNIEDDGTTLKFELTVTDLGGLQSTATTLVIVGRGDLSRPPRADAGPDRSVEAGATVSLNGSNSSDPDGEIEFYLWSQVSGPSVSFSDPRSAEPTIVAPVNVDLQGVSLVLQLTVTDNEGLQSVDSCIVNVVQEGGNRPPVADAGENRIVRPGDTVALDGSLSRDPDGDETVMSFFWSQLSGPPVELSSPTGIQPSFTAPSSVSSEGISLVFQLTVEDEGRLQSTDTTVVSVTIAGRNQPPVADPGGPQAVNPVETVTLDATGSTDPDSTDPSRTDDISGYLWAQIGGPPVTLSNPREVRPTFVAPNVAAGTAELTFRLTVTDLGGLQDTDTTTVTVDSGVPSPGGKLPPVADGGPCQSVLPAERVILSGANSAGRDSAIAGYVWGQMEGPPVTLSSRTAVRPTFEAPVEVDKQGVALVFQLTVEDLNDLGATDLAIVNVLADLPPADRNNPPVAHAGPDQNVAPGQNVVLDGSASYDLDDEDAIASYEWIQVDGPSVALDDPTAPRPSFEAPARSNVSLKFRLVVADEGGLLDRSSVIVNLVSLDAPSPQRNDPPFADAGLDGTVRPGQAVTLDGGDSRDPDDEIDAYWWRQLEGPPVALSDPSAPRPDFTAPETGEDGLTLTFELTVADTFGLRATDRSHVNVTVQGGNRPPVADAGEDRTVGAGRTVTLDGTASEDPDEDALAYRWLQVLGPPVTIAAPDAPRASFTMPSLDNVTLAFDLTVADDKGLKSTDTVLVSTVRQAGSKVVGGVESGEIVVAGVDPDEYESFEVVLSRQAEDGTGRIYISAEVKGIEAWERFMWLRPRDESTPPYVVLASDGNGFLEDAEEAYFFEGSLDSRARNLPGFVIGGLEDLQGNVLVFKSWYLMDGDAFNEDDLRLMQTVIVAIGSEAPEGNPTIGGAEAGDPVLAVLDPEKHDAFSVLLSQQAEDAGGFLYVSMQVLGIPQWEPLIWFRPSEDNVPPYIEVVGSDGRFFDNARLSYYFQGALSAARVNLDPLFVGGDLEGMRGTVLIVKSWYLLQSQAFNADNLHRIQTVMVSVPSPGS